MTTKIKEFKGALKPIFNDPEQETKAHINDSSSTQDLSIDVIRARYDQPRKIFNEEALTELAQSIKSKGVIQPIIVKALSDGYYEIVIGERRWRAAKEAGLKKIPVIIREYNKSDSMAVSLIENIQRENLNPLEEAQAIQGLLEECSLTHSQVAESIGKSRTTITNLLRLLNLEMEVKAMINAGILEMGHARALLSLPPTTQINIAKQIVARALSVRETERLVQRTNEEDIPEVTNMDPAFQQKAKEWVSGIAKQLSSKVNVHFNHGGKGRVVIHFDSIEEADWLMQHIQINNNP